MFLANTATGMPLNVTADGMNRHGPLASRGTSTYIKTAAVGPFPEGFAEESYNGFEGVISGADTSLTVSGNVRAYWTRDFQQHAWSSISYKTLDLRGKSLRWTTDISRVGCGCNAALYLVAMPAAGQGDISGYCDIQGSGSGYCLEIDLLEGNKKAIQTTLHTQHGKQTDGTCNQYGASAGIELEAIGQPPPRTPPRAESLSWPSWTGCAINWGKDDQSRYGLGSPVDSGRPYEMDAAFDADGHMTVKIQQDGTWHEYWNVSSAGNGTLVAGRKGVPEEASQAVASAMERGAVLAISLWESKDDTAWLNGACNSEVRNDMM